MLRVVDPAIMDGVFSTAGPSGTCPSTGPEVGPSVDNLPVHSGLTFVAQVRVLHSVRLSPLCWLGVLPILSVACMCVTQCISCDPVRDRLTTDGEFMACMMVRSVASRSQE